jgi:hypothetical protein
MGHIRTSTKIGQSFDGGADTAFLVYSGDITVVAPTQSNKAKEPYLSSNTITCPVSHRGPNVFSSFGIDLLLFRPRESSLSLRLIPQNASVLQSIVFPGDSLRSVATISLAVRLLAVALSSKLNE